MPWAEGKVTSMSWGRKEFPFDELKEGFYERRSYKWLPRHHLRSGRNAHMKMKELNNKLTSNPEFYSSDFKGR